jgi:ParB-like nuclease domain
MSDLFPLPYLVFEKEPAPAADLGPKPELAWIRLDQLFIDPKYQRSVREDGRRNIKRIVERFRWSYFSPLIVSRRGPDRYAVIDGQHRGIGGVTHGGVKTVPCLIIDATQEEEAMAFAIINGQVTSMLPGQIYYARLAGNDPKALAVDAVCRAADVTILKWSKGQAGKSAVGETFAIGTIERCLEVHGRDVLITALQLVTQTGDGNPGLLGQAIIYAGCEVLGRHPKWRDAGEKLFKAIETVSIPRLLKQAEQRRVDRGGAFRAHLIALLTDLFERELGDGGKVTAVSMRVREAGDQTGRRFTGKPHVDRDPATIKHIGRDHPAIKAARTIFPSTVVSPAKSERLLISGANSVKLGKRVMKGPWEGFPIFQLSLEERATCSPDCHVYLECYGNAMPFARRHRNDSTLMPALWTELTLLQRDNPRGFVVRLHVLGDFFSPEYVTAWKRFLNEFPALHVFGYTAWPRSSVIGSAIGKLADSNWDRFAIRFSSAQPGPQGATTIWRKPEGSVVSEGQVCPAQTDATACCASCGLCWSPAARDKTIVFIGHGGVGNGGRKPAELKLGAKVA